MSEQDARYRTSKNEEDQVSCPYCDATVASRGLYQHVWRSGDSDHGGHKELPDTWEQDRQEVETVGTRSITLNVPTHKKFDHERLLCKYCGEDFKGTHGLSVHLARVSDSQHPEDADVQKSSLRVPVGPDDAIVLDDEMLEGVSGHNIDPDEFSDSSILETTGQEDGENAADSTAVPDGFVPIPDLVELVGYYERQGRSEAAEELRKLLKKY